MPRDETRDVLIICNENGAPSNEYAGFWYHRTTTAKSLPIAPKDSLERFSPHSQLSDLERQLVERANERDGALFTLLHAREALQAGNDELALHILEDDQAIDLALDTREKTSELERQLADREDAIRQLQEAANELALRERGLRAALCEAVDVIGRATNLQMVPMARDLLCATLETAVDALEAKP